MKKLIFLPLILIACGGSESKNAEKPAAAEKLEQKQEAEAENLSVYYFDLEDFKETKVYVFQNDNDPGDKYYWEMTADLKNRTLTSNAYDNMFFMNNQFVEQYGKEGTKLLKYVNYRKGKNGVETSDCAIISDDVFKWDVSNAFSYSFIEQFPGEAPVTITKTRRPLTLAKILVMGEEVMCYQLDDMYTTNIPGEEDAGNNIAYYGKDMGVIKTDHVYQDEEGYHIVSYCLSKILTKAEWDSLRDAVADHNHEGHDH